ncbi:MAG: N-acetylmuramic acid 6-phosphate etherase [Parabacteroides sp.]
MREIVLSLDIGGTWIKGATYSCEDLWVAYQRNTLPKALVMAKVESCLSSSFALGSFLGALRKIINGLLTPDMQLSSIAISTAGVVDYAGKRLKFVASHLSPLKETDWIECLRKEYDVLVVLVNDANATMIGDASLGYLTGQKIIGIMPIGTGLGFSVWRNGRIWTPNFSYTLLGCVQTPYGDYDSLASIVGLAKRNASTDLKTLFCSEEYKECVDEYLSGLLGIIQTAYFMYHTSEVLIGGGLADFVVSIGYDLEGRLNELLKSHPLVDGVVPLVRVTREGNQLPLIGAALLGYGEAVAQKGRWIKPYTTISTENAYDTSLHLERMGTKEVVNLLWTAEDEAGRKLKSSLEDISQVAARIVERLKSGGRLIYVGAGTSGRLAAIDTVEIGCTFGFPRERVLTFIAGGIADAAIDIEMNFEEDASAVPEMLAAFLNEKDVVIGISVSGTAYYVQSALAFAKHMGAYSVLIQEEDKALPFCDKVIPLRTGYEVVAGSTRMKAGTATKKVLNFLSTTVMVSLGKVHGCYMTELECINQKLIQRAVSILMKLFGLTEDEAFGLLKESSFSLNEAIAIRNKKVTN